MVWVGLPLPTDGPNGARLLLEQNREMVCEEILLLLVLVLLLVDYHHRWKFPRYHHRKHHDTSFTLTDVSTGRNALLPVEFFAKEVR